MLIKIDVQRKLTENCCEGRTKVHSDSVTPSVSLPVTSIHIYVSVSACVVKCHMKGGFEFSRVQTLDRFSGD